MEKKRASELFRQVDPSLKVIDGGTHYHRHRPRHSTREDWDKTMGVACPDCKQETMRLIEGICSQCYNEKVAKRERKKEERSERSYYSRRLREGTISLAQMRGGRL